MEPLQSERITIDTPHGKSLGSAAASYVHLLTDDFPDPDFLDALTQRKEPKGARPTATNATRFSAVDAAEP